MSKFKPILKDDFCIAKIKRIKQLFILNNILHNMDDCERYRAGISLHDRAMEDLSKYLKQLKLYYFIEINQHKRAINDRQKSAQLHDYSKNDLNKRFFNDDYYFFDAVNEFYNTINGATIDLIASNIQVEFNNFIKNMNMEKKDIVSYLTNEKNLSKILKEYYSTVILNTVNCCEALSITLSGKSRELSPVFYFDGVRVLFIKNSSENRVKINNNEAFHHFTHSLGVNGERSFDKYSINGGLFINKAVNDVFEMGMGDTLIQLFSQYNFNDVDKYKKTAVDISLNIKNVNQLFMDYMRLCNDDEVREIMINFVDHYSTVFDSTLKLSSPQGVQYDDEENSVILIPKFLWINIFNILLQMNYMKFIRRSYRRMIQKDLLNSPYTMSC